MTSFRSALVTGATGFLGSVLVEHLLAKGVETTCLVRPSAADSRKIPKSVRTIETTSFQASQLKTKLAGVSADVIFNLASYGVRPSDRDPHQLIEGNIDLLTDLLEATADWPLRRFVHTGSCSEYGFPERENVPVAESQPLRPASLYGSAKASSVLFGTALASRLNIPFITLRLFGVFGPHEAPDRLIPYLIAKLRRDEPVDLTPGEQIRDLLYEDDVAEAFIAAADAIGMKSSEAYNVCSARPTRIRDVGEAVADELGKPRHLLHWGERQYRADEPLWLVGDNRRFTATTSWSPRVTVEEGIRRMIAATPLSGKTVSTSMHFDRFAGDYKQVLDQSLAVSGQDSSYFAEYKARYLRRQLSPDFSGKVLDFGCGIGLLSGFLKKHLPAIQLDGFDVSQDSIRKVEPSLTAQGTFTCDWSQLARDYQLIVIANVMHHIPPPQRKDLIQELADRLKPGGSLAIFEHNPANPVTRWVVEHCPFDDDAILLPPAETRGYLNGAQLFHKRRDYIVFLPHFLASLRWIEPWLFWLPMGAQYVMVAEKND